MRVAVTGASGFIGRTLCGALARSQHGSVALDPRIQKLNLHGADAVVHLAAIAHRRGVDAAELSRVNVDLAARVGEAAAAAGVPLVFMSSVKVHGEESIAPLTESAALAPRDAYAESKARAEQALRVIPGLKLVVLRPPLVYGPGVKANFLALASALARGLPLPFASIANRRSLVYVANLADAILHCMATPQAIGRSYLVCDGAAVSTPELCRKLGGALGRPARLFPFPVAALELLPGARKLTRSLEIDDTALRRDLDWRAPFTLEQGLRATADWYLRR